MCYAWRTDHLGIFVLMWLSGGGNILEAIRGLPADSGQIGHILDHISTPDELQGLYFGGSGGFRQSTPYPS